MFVGFDVLRVTHKHKAGLIASATRRKGFSRYTGYFVFLTMCRVVRDFIIFRIYQICLRAYTQLPLYKCGARPPFLKRAWPP